MKRKLITDPLYNVPQCKDITYYINKITIIIVMLFWMQTHTKTDNKMLQ